MSWATHTHTHKKIFGHSSALQRCSCKPNHGAQGVIHGLNHDLIRNAAFSFKGKTSTAYISTDNNHNKQSDALKIRAHVFSNTLHRVSINVHRQRKKIDFCIYAFTQSSGHSMRLSWSAVSAVPLARLVFIPADFCATPAAARVDPVMALLILKAKSIRHIVGDQWEWEINRRYWYFAARTI